MTMSAEKAPIAAARAMRAGSVDGRAGNRTGVNLASPNLTPSQ